MCANCGNKWNRRGRVNEEGVLIGIMMVVVVGGKDAIEQKRKRMLKFVVAHIHSTIFTTKM